MLCFQSFFACGMSGYAFSGILLVTFLIQCLQTTFILTLYCMYCLADFRDVSA